MGVPVSPLVRFAIRGLQSCWMPSQRLFSYACRPYQRERNVSQPPRDVFYTINVLLGLSRLRPQDCPWDREALFRHACARMLQVPVPRYAWGTALWAAAELDLDVPGEVVDAILDQLSRPEAWGRWTAQDLAMTISGVVARAAREPDPWESHAHRLMAHLKSHHTTPVSHLFFKTPTGLRRRGATFATGLYSSMACFHYGEHFGDTEAIRRALDCVRVLRERQGPRGEWPWFYEVTSQLAVDHYPVFSVHQDGMAPALLRLAHRHGDQEAPAALARGFHWILGQNELGRSMLVPELGLVLRAQVRAEPLERPRRVARAVLNWRRGRSSDWAGADRVGVTLECRSYHLGWIVWSFGGRDDFRELTHHALFEEAPEGADAEGADPESADVGQHAGRANPTDHRGDA